MILDGLDRETVKTRVFFMVICHGTCRKCWFVDGDHFYEKCKPRIIAYKKNFPKVYVYNEEGEESGDENEEFQHQEAPNRNRMNSLATAVASLLIYDSEIDKVEYQNRGTKRIRIDNEFCFNEEENESERRGNIGIIGDGWNISNVIPVTVISEDRGKSQRRVIIMRRR